MITWRFKISEVCCSKKRFMCGMVVVLFTVHLLWVLTFINRNKSIGLLHFGDPIPKGFEVKFTSREKELILKTVDAFHRAMNDSGIPFFMYGGTLIGSYRHHGQIPWDDDVDFALPLVLKKNASAVLQGLEPEFCLNEKQRVRWKLFSNKASRIKRVPWKFPFVDISFYHQNETHIWDEDSKNFKNFVFPVDMVLPLSQRPFEGRWLPSPRDALGMINQNYNMSECKTGTWSHQKEKGGQRVNVLQCKEIYSVFPFVERVYAPDGDCVENLVLDGIIISWILMNNSTC